MKEDFAVYECATKYGTLKLHWPIMVDETHTVEMANKAMKEYYENKGTVPIDGLGETLILSLTPNTPTNE